MGFAVVVSCTILPIVIASTASRPDGGQIHCENGLTATLLEVSDGSRIDLIDDSLADQSHIPDIRLADFQAGLRKMNDLIRPEHFNELMNLTAGTTIFIDQDGWLIGESAQFPDQISMVWICERPRDSFFRYIDSIRSTSLRKP